MKGVDLYPKATVTKSLQMPQTKIGGAHLDQISTKGLWSHTHKKATHKCSRAESDVLGLEDNSIA